MIFISSQHAKIIFQLCLFKSFRVVAGGNGLICMFNSDDFNESEVVSQSWQAALKEMWRR